ncbi:MAG: hypothetical protein AAGF11_51580 [Myxococcota bacterium]
MVRPRGFVERFQDKRWSYERLADLVRRYLAWQVECWRPKSGLPLLHLTQARAKDPRSLQRNLDRAQRYKKEPTCLHDVGDLAAARLIFYFRTDLDEFCEYANTQLSRWFGESSKLEDMRSPGMQDKVREVFGYDSYHLDIEVTPETDLFDHLRPEDQEIFEQDGEEGAFRCEVQLRTILQHAWAEAEHDIGYKGVPLDPRERRLWGTLSAMLEGADHLLGERLTKVSKAAARSKVESTWKWSYDGESLPDSVFTRNDVRFRYELLDKGPKDPTIERAWTLFDLNKAMRGIIDESFKQQVWSALQAEEPEFLASFRHDSTVARVQGFDRHTRVITVQPAQYSDQMVTNHRHAAKQGIPGDGKTVGDLARSEDGALLPFDTSPLSNTIGVACMLRTAEQSWVVTVRGYHVAFEPGKAGCSASGALEWVEPDSWNGGDLRSWVCEGLAQEFHQELGFRPIVQEFVYLGFARELDRFGKPQFFFLLDSNLHQRQIEGSWKLYADEGAAREHSTLLFLDHGKAKTLASKDSSDVRDALSTTAGGTPPEPSEELRMNLALALDHLS